jgi:PadR family transcriptional regulator PadR
MPRRRQSQRGRFLRMTRFLEPALCLLLHHNPAHGYTLIEKSEAFGLGGMDSGVVYRALRDMEQRGWVTSTWDTERAQGPRRRVYRLTVEGDQVLEDWVRDLRRTRKQIGYLVNIYDRHMEEGEGEYH